MNDLQEHKSISIADFIQLLRRRIVFIISVVFTTVIVVALYSYLMPQTYTAVATLMPPEQRSSGGGLAALLQSAAPGISLGGMDSKSSQISADIITSNSLIERVIQRLNLPQHPFFKDMDTATIIAIVKASLYIDSRIRTGVTGIECTIGTKYLASEQETSSAAQLSSDIANAVTVCLDQMLRDKNVSTARKTREFIERLMVTTKQKLDSSQEALEQFQLSNKVFTIDDQTKAIVSSAVSIGTELSKAQIELAAIKQQYQPNSAIVQSFEQKVNSLQSQYEKAQNGGIAPVDKYSIPLGNVPHLGRKYLNLMRDMKIQEQINAYLESQRMQEAIQEARDVPVIQVLDKAIKPRQRTTPKRSLMIVLTFGLSLVFSVLWVGVSAAYTEKK
jgi:capsule polysaccharide export protein KpsE/RkpR